MRVRRGFKFKTEIFACFLILIVFVLAAVMQLLYVVLKNNYHEMDRSILDTQAKQIAMNIDSKIGKIGYYTSYADLLRSNRNLIYAVENDDFATVEDVLNYETAKFMLLNKGRISKIQIYRNGIYTSKYYDLRPIFREFALGGSAYTSNVYWTGTYLNDRNEKVFSLFMKLFQGNPNRTYLIELCFYETELFSLINKPNNNYNVAVFNGGMLMSTSDREWFSDHLYGNKQAYSGVPESAIEKNPSFFRISSKTESGWDVVITFNNDYLDRNFLRLYTGLVPVVLIVLAIASLLGTWVSAQLNRRFSILHRKIESISRWDLTQDRNMTGSDEFKLLSDALDDTRERIVGLIGQINDINEQKRVAEVAALRSQINSHFLFNALSSIKWLSRNDDTKAVAEAVDKLALILRYSLSLSENMVPLKDEVEQLEAYVYFQKQRFHEEINVNIDIDAELMACRTVKLILQPLVENAIYHGRRADGSLLNITVYSFASETEYDLIVEDDGNGIPQERIPEILSRREEAPPGSIGLKNVIDRIRLCSGNQGELTIESKVDCYTKITIRQKRQ